MKLLVVGLLFIVGQVKMSANNNEVRTGQAKMSANNSESRTGQAKMSANNSEARTGQVYRTGNVSTAYTTLEPGQLKSYILQYKKEFPGQEWQYEGILPKAFPLEKVRKVFSSSTTQAQINQKLQHRKEFPGQESEHDGLPIEFPNITAPKSNVTEVPVPTMKVELSENVSRRVYNPDESSSIEDYPFMAALLVNKELWCGAVIITRDKVLTAAHCLQLQYNNRFFREYVKMLSVRVGSTNATFGGDLLRVSEIMFHPNYRPQTLSFNFALLKLHKNMTFGKEQVRAEAVPFSTKRTVPVDTKVQFLGWGSVMSTGGGGGQVLLQRLSLPVYDLADCQHVYGRDLVTRNNFCAGYITMPKNVCNHDAGGPAIMDGVLIGILSFSSKTCDEKDHPAVFSTVGAVTDWLEKLID